MRSTKRFDHCCAAVLSMLTAVACSGEAGEFGAPESVETTEQGIWNVWHGGRNGSTYSTSATTYYGYALRCGLYVDQLTLYGSGGRWGPYGGPGGSPSGDYYCPGNTNLIGVFGRQSTNTLINQLGFVCGTDDHSSMLNGLACGGGGGTPFTDICPVGQRIKMFNIQADSLFNGFQIYCARP